jgi:hypothetical protein
VVFARALAADLRAAAARYPDDPGVQRLVRRLRAASPEFAGLWDGQDLRVTRSSRKRLRHPAVGWLELDCEALHDPDRGQWVILYTAPPGSQAAGALRLLRVVGLQNMTAGS